MMLADELSHLELQHNESKVYADHHQVTVTHDNVPERGSGVYSVWPGLTDDH